MRATALGAMLGAALLAACSNAGSNPTGSHGPGTTTSTASYARAAAQTPKPGLAAGAIAGNLGYPAEFLPAQAVYAITTDGDRYYRVETVVGQFHYTLLGVAAGEYFVFSMARMPGFLGSASGARTSSGLRFGAGYTKFVTCGLSYGCSDHAPITVDVAPGATTSGIDPVDWYMTSDSYPLVPDGGAPLPAGSTSPATFATADEAAASLAQSRTAGRPVQALAACPVNVACVWLSGRHDGHAAAYFTGGAGSNNDVQTCGVYVVNDAGSWQILDIRCRNAATPFPAIGSSGVVALGMGETGCVNVHAAPGISAKVVACLNEGTKVGIDGGPYFIPRANSSALTNPPTNLDCWWHVAGRGWMVHRYLS